MAYAMFLNLFLFGAEVFKEFYSGTEHAIHMRFLFFGLDGHAPLAPYAWTSLVFSLVAFILLLLPSTRRNPITLNLGCLLIYAGVYIEKGMGLVIPGMTPDTLGEIYEYGPSWTEVGVGAGIFAIGSLLFTLLAKGAIAILDGDLRARGVGAALPAEHAKTVPVAALALATPPTEPSPQAPL
jgi:Ni/Fe-hydrogenase subunit HybB-like protein